MKKVGDRMCVLFDISFIDYEDEMSNEGKHRWSNESELARPCAIKYARSVCVRNNKATQTSLEKFRYHLARSLELRY